MTEGRLTSRLGMGTGRTGQEYIAARDHFGELWEEGDACSPKAGAQRPCAVAAGEGALLLCDLGCFIRFPQCGSSNKTPDGVEHHRSASGADLPTSCSAQRCACCFTLYESTA